VVVDKSNSPMSRKLVSMVDATRGVKVVDEAHSIAKAEQLLRRGDVLSIVYINSDFESSILRGEPTKVECYLLGTNISADGVIERDVQQAVMTFSAGVSLSRLQASGVGYDEAMVEIMPINIHSNIVANPYLNYGYYLAPLFMFMGVVILTVVSTVYAFGRELRDATAREWLATSNNSLVAAVVGKMLPTTIVMSVMMEFVLFILVVVMGMECTGSYLFLSLSILLFVLAYQSVAIVIISLAATLRLGLSLGGGYAVMAFTFSGITFPVSAFAMPLPVVVTARPLKTPAKVSPLMACVLSSLIPGAMPPMKY
jgi:ABC-2 type transport system permease protein